MNLVNAYYILEGEHKFTSFPSSLEGEYPIDISLKMDIGRDGYGKFYWGKKPLYIYGYDYLIYVYDMRRIICFTSSVVNVLKLIDFINDQHSVSMKIAKIHVESLPNIINNEIQYYEIDPITGITFTLISTEKEQSWPSVVKVFKTGLTTFNMTSNKDIIMKIINQNIKFLEISQN